MSGGRLGRAGWPISLVCVGMLLSGLLHFFFRAKLRNT